MRHRSIGLLTAFWVLSTCTYADPQGTFTISQVSLQQSAIKIYLDVLDRNGQPPANLAGSDLSATLQGQTLNVVRVTSFAASGEGVAYLFLIDVSKSITAQQFKQNQRFTNLWIDGMSPPDRMALATIGHDYRQVTDFTGDKSILQGALATLKPADLETKLYLALYEAVSQVGRADQGLPGRRVIVVLSDGLDEGSNIAEADVIGTLKQAHVPVYAVWASHLRVPSRQQGLDALSRIAASSQGSFLNATAEPVRAISEDLKNAIGRAFVVTLDCQSCQPASQPQPLQISLKSGDTPRTSEFDLALTLPPQNSPKPPSNEQQHGFDWSKLISLRILLPLTVVLASSVTFVIVRKYVIRPKSTPTTIAPPQGPEHGKRVAIGVVIPVAAKGLPLRFTTVAGKEAGREYQLSLVERIVVGRDRGCDLALPEDTEVSNRHCELTRKGHTIELNDLKSRNGTLLNGARVVARRPLESGDLIRVGRTELRVSFEDPK